MKTTVFLLLFSAQVLAQHHTRLNPATIEVHYHHTMQRDTVRRLATADFRGRRWTAWFATDIPVSDGPWKLGGLPGLILEAYDEGQQHVFTAVGLERVKDEPIIFNRSCVGNRKFEQTNRLEFLRSKKKSLMDLNGYIQMETGIDLSQGKPQKVMRYDLLEHDY